MIELEDGEARLGCLEQHLLCSRREAHWVPIARNECDGRAVLFSYCQYYWLPPRMLERAAISNWNQPKPWYAHGSHTTINMAINDLAMIRVVTKAYFSSDMIDIMLDLLIALQWNRILKVRKCTFKNLRYFLCGEIVMNQALNIKKNPRIRRRKYAFGTTLVRIYHIYN